MESAGDPSFLTKTERHVLMSIGMERKQKIKDGHIVVENSLYQERC